MFYSGERGLPSFFRHPDSIRKEEIAIGGKLFLSNAGEAQSSFPRSAPLWSRWGIFSGTKMELTLLLLLQSRPG